jgi:hypothetical protein
VGLATGLDGDVVASLIRDAYRGQGDEVDVVLDVPPPARR